MKSFIFLIVLLVVWVNVVLFTEYENEFELSEQFLANDSTHIIFAQIGNSVIAEYKGEIREADNASECIKFRNAIRDNDTIYVYDRYKGIIPFINWPLIKVGGYISTDRNKTTY